MDSILNIEQIGSANRPHMKKTKRRKTKLPSRYPKGNLKWATGCQPVAAQREVPVGMET